MTQPHTHSNAATIHGDHPSHAPADAQASAQAETPPDTLTLYSPDGQFKAELRAWKDYWFFYNSIGAKLDVYHRQESKDTWGHKTMDWVSCPATIFMKNRYTGSLNTPAVSGPSTTPPPGGGETTIDVSMQISGPHCEHRLWATGFFSTKINVNADGFSERTYPNGAVLDVARVDSEIAIAVGDTRLSGIVSAGSYIKDNSAW